MVIGWIVIGDFPARNEDGTVDFYMAQRERLFGYPQRPPRYRIPAAGVIRDTNAPPGLLRTIEEATQVQQLMQDRFPDQTWRIRRWEDENGEELDFGTN